MIIDCLSKIILIFGIFTLVTILLFGIPKSMCEIYNLYKTRENILKFLLPAFYISNAIFLTPCLIKCSSETETVVLSLAIGCMFIFASALHIFESKFNTDTPHNTLSWCYIILSISWILFATPYWYIYVFCLSISILLAIITHTLKKCYLYWFENATLISVIISALLYYLNFIK